MKKKTIKKKIVKKKVVDKKKKTYQPTEDERVAGLLEMLESAESTIKELEEDAELKAKVAERIIDFYKDENVKLREELSVASEDILDYSDKVEILEKVMRSKRLLKLPVILKIG